MVSFPALRFTPVNTPSNTLQDNSDQAQAYDQVTNRPHEAKWSHELIGGAAAYEAAKAYEDHVARNGMFCFQLLRAVGIRGRC